MTTGPSAAVRLLRDRTVARAVRGYVRWIGRAVGWWSVAYLVFWAGVFVTAGVESVPVASDPIALPLAGLSGGALALLLLAPLVGRATPPVRLDRRDLIRLALAPVTPWRAMRWPFARRLVLRALAGIGLGLIWTLLAGAWFGAATPYAAPATALLLVAQANLAWAGYAEAGTPWGRRPGTGLALVATLAALAGWPAPAWGLGAALSGPSPAGLVGPALLAALSGIVARRSLRYHYPPRFAPQCFVLGQMQALRTWQLLSTMAGTGGGSDPGERQRLLAVLHDRPHARRPRRSLPLPAPHRAPWAAVAWRGLQALYRRPVVHHLGVLTLLTAAFLAAGSGAGAFLGVQLPAFVLTVAASRLLGGGGLPATVPLSPSARTLGRIVPGVALTMMVAATSVTAASLAGVPVAPTRVVVMLTLLPLAFLAVEKIGSWLGGGASTEAVIAAALVAATPSFLATAFDVPELTVPGQLLAIFVMLLLPV